MYLHRAMDVTKVLDLKSPFICREVSEFLADKKEGQHNILKNTGLGVSRVVHGALLPQEGHLTIWGLGCPYSWPSDPVVPTQLPLACLIWTPVQQMAVTF